MIGKEELCALNMQVDVINNYDHEVLVSWRK